MLLAGCAGSIDVRPPDITATQQTIMAMAENKALNSLAAPLPLRLSYVDQTYWTGSKYELGAFREWLIRGGVPITDDQKKADVIIEPLSAVDSFNVKGLFIGIPELKLSIEADTPAVTFFSATTDIAIAQMSILAYDAHTGAPLASADSKYGIQFYHVVKTLLTGVHDTPHLTPDQLAE